MKKLLLCAAIAGVALSSCVKDEAEMSQTPSQKITFDSPVMYSNENTRANVYGEIGATVEGTVIYTYPKAESFVVYAIGHEATFTSWADGVAAAFNGKAISYDANVNGWAPKTEQDKYYYWQADRMMTFAATSPADLEQTHWQGADKRTYTEDGLKIEDFVISADASKQYDLLFSKRVFNQTSANMSHGAGSYNGLSIVFQHALSSIRFSIANESEEELVLTGIEVAGVKYKGTFNENITEQGTLYDRTPETGNVAPEWTVENELVANPYIAFAGSVNFLEQPRYVSELATSTDKCNQLLLMPQELTDDAVVTVHYTVNGKENNKTVKLKGLKSHKQVDGNDVETGTISSWGMGKRYTYRLFYSKETSKKDKIYFAPSTEGWEDVDVIIVNL